MGQMISDGPAGLRPLVRHRPKVTVLNVGALPAGDNDGGFNLADSQQAGLLFRFTLILSIS
jgi:hypothetical protein